MVFRYWGGRHPVQQFRQDMDRLMNGVLNNVSEMRWPLAGRNQPAINLWEDTAAIYAELELPGVKSDDLELAVAGAELSVKVDRPDVEEEGVTYHRRERGVGSFARMVQLPVEVDPEGVEAELVQGVLTVRLPKSEAARPRKIKVAGPS